MHLRHLAFQGLVLVFVTSALAGQQGVRVKRDGNRVTLSNDYLERVLQVTDGTLHTRQFTNRLSHGTYLLSGDEFRVELSLTEMHTDVTNPLTIGTGDLKVLNLEVTDSPAGGRRVVVQMEPRHPVSQVTGLAITAVYELNPTEFFTRQWLTLRVSGKGTFFLHAVWPQTNSWAPADFHLGGLGQPLLSDDLFAGLEYPSSLNSEDQGELRLGSIVGLKIPAEGYTSEPVVLGVAAAGHAHEAFMDYVGRIRLAPPRPFILYNTWYDLQGTVMNSQNVLERIPLLEEKLVHKFGLDLDSFVLDDGWDDPENLWRIDPSRFPGGFRDLTAALDNAHSKLGIWFGPMGGYGGGPATMRSVRIATGQRHGMEVDSSAEYFCLAGKNYSAYLRDSMLRLIHDYGVNYFKLDGIPFACSEPDHGHPVGIYSREAYVRSVIDLAKSLHAANPQAFIALATGPWLSPWWLRYGDTVDYGGEDYAYLDEVPSLTPRQSAMSYNDSVLYRNYALHQVQFPMSSLDGEGIIKGKFNLLGGESEPLEDWRDAVVGFAASGVMRADLYLTPSILRPQEWEVLGRTLRYFKDNAHPLLENGTWVLGNPARGEPYGIVHASAEKTIVLLRNPSIEPAHVSLPLTRANGFQSDSRPLKAEIIYPYREALPGNLHLDDTLPSDLDGFEQRIIEIRPAEFYAGLPQGLPFSLDASARGGATLRVFGHPAESKRVRLPDSKAVQDIELDDRRVMAEKEQGGQSILVRFQGPERQRLTFSTPTVQSTQSASGERAAKVGFSVLIPQETADATLGLLMQAATSLGDARAEARINGNSAALAAQKSAHGLWYWWEAHLAAGRDQAEFTLHIPPGLTALPRISGWLRVRNQLVAAKLVLKFDPQQSGVEPLPDPLPASSDLERKTYRLFDQPLDSVTAITALGQPTP